MEGIPRSFRNRIAGKPKRVLPQTTKKMVAYFHKPNHKYATQKSGKTAMLTTISSQTTAIGSINGMRSVERQVRDHIAFAPDSCAGSMMRLSSNKTPTQLLCYGIRFQRQLWSDKKRAHNVLST
jgi:hypothetical protein